MAGGLKGVAIGRKVIGAGAMAAALTVGLVGACAPRPSLGSLKALGETSRARGDYETAVTAYSQVLERRPGDVQTRYRLGLAQMELGQTGLARESFTVAHDIEPFNPIYRGALIEAMIVNGERAEAFAMLRRFAEETSGVEGYLALGRASERAGLPDDAERAFLVAAELGGDDPRPQRALADFYRQIGDRPRELERLRVLLYLLPEENEVIERIRTLGEIPGPSLAVPPSALKVGS